MRAFTPTSNERRQNRHLPSARSDAMKHMLLIYETPDTPEIFTGEDGTELMAQVDRRVRP